MKKAIFIMIFLFFFLGQNALALNIHREHSKTYAQELSDKTKSDKDEDEDLLENLPIIPFKNPSSDNENMPIFTPGATFSLPNKGG